MTDKSPHVVFLTGTGTNVGKTYVGAALARSLVRRQVRVGVYKPVLSGCQRLEPEWPVPPAPGEPPADLRRSEVLDGADDDMLLWQAAGCPGSLRDVAPQRFAAPLAPYLAAREAGRVIDEPKLTSGLDRWTERSDWTLVEGAGGLFSPLTERHLNIDLGRELRHRAAVKVVLVARNALGVMHAALSTWYAAARYLEDGLPIDAIVLNDVADDPDDASRASNAPELRRWCAPCPVFCHAADQPLAEELATRLLIP